MQRYSETTRQPRLSIGEVVSQHQVLRNTYMLLSLTLLFSALCAGVAMAMNIAPLHWIIVLVGYFGLLFAVQWQRNSIWGLVLTFALTGFMGFTLGPIISIYLDIFSNGSQIVMMALGGTGASFLGLSAYALTTKRDFSGYGKFLMVGILVAFGLGIIALIFSIPMLHLAVSAMFVLLMGMLIVWETQQIVQGGETNYVLATVTLFVAIYNMFLSLLQLLGFFFGEE